MSAIRSPRSDIRPEAAQAAAAQTKGTAYTKLAGVTAAADVIVTVVSDDAAMERIFAERGDSLLEGAKGKIFVNCATVTPAMHIEVQRRAEARGAHSLEACMASSITQARNGTLYLMVGGRRQVFERVQPMFAKMSASLRYIGEAGRAAHKGSGVGKQQRSKILLGKSAGGPCEGRGDRTGVGNRRLGSGKLVGVVQVIRRSN